VRLDRRLALGAVLALLFAQGCLGRAPAPATPPPTSAPTPGTVGATPTLAGSPTTAGTTPGTPAIRPAPTATATEPKLGINPPASPSGSPGRTPATPVTPVVQGRPATIMEIQGQGNRSPLIAQTVRTTGVVTADFQGTPARGFFLQDPASDRDPETSHGIFVFQGDRPTLDVKVGDAVTIIGIAREFNDRTELDISLPASYVTVTSSGNRLPEPVELQPPVKNAEAATYYERLEGMLVRVPPAIVVGPTSRFGEFTVVRQDSGLTRVMQADPRGTGERIVVDDEGGPDAHYELTDGDRVTGLIGPLDYTFGQYKIEQLAEARLQVIPGDRPVPAAPQAGPGEFTVTSFNLENVFDPLDTPGKLDPCDLDTNGNPCSERVTPEDYARKLTKSALAIRDALGAPTLVAVQEVENLDVLDALAAQPELAPFGYGAILVDGLDPRGINVGLLYRKDRVAIGDVAQRNACTAKNYGFSDVEARCSTTGDGTLDGWYISARPPLVVSLTVRGDNGSRALTLIINHFKARSGTDPESKEFVSRRTEEARLVAATVDELLAADPRAAVLVLGDLNDFVGSEPLQVLTTTAPLRELALGLPEAERYSYVFNGESEVLDHILATPNLAATLAGFTFIHLDADYPDSRARDRTFYRVSDHDPPLARFKLGD